MNRNSCASDANPFTGNGFAYGVSPTDRQFHSLHFGILPQKVAEELTQFRLQTTMRKSLANRLHFRIDAIRRNRQGQNEYVKNHAVLHFAPASEWVNGNTGFEVTEIRGLHGLTVGMPT